MPLATPVIVQEPQDAAVREGEAARFAVELKDERAASYQWLKNDVAVAGANEKQLVLARVTDADDQALFRVVVTNAAGSTQSRQALLKVQALASVTGEVVKSDWSETLPPTLEIFAYFAGDFIGDFVGISASGFVYYLNEPKNALDQYRPDGTLARQLVLPPAPAGVPFIEQVSVIEDPVTHAVLIAVGRSTPSWRINSKFTAGGFIARYTDQTPQILFESDTITPGGLARDGEGRLYFTDLETQALLRTGPAGENLKVLYGSVRAPGAKPVDFTFLIKADVAVAGDGTVYAKTDRASLSSRDTVVRWRNGTVDLVNLLAGLSEPTDGSGVGRGLGMYGGNVFVFVRTKKNVLVRMLNADGTLTTVAGTPDTVGSTQFGSPGVLDKDSRWLGITSDGRVHLDAGDKNSRRFFDVQLRARR